MTEAAVPKLDLLITGDIQEWVSVLPPYQGELIRQMLVTQSPEDVAKSWLSGTGPSDTAPFGAIRTGAVLYYINLLRELQKLLCGNTDYPDERENLRKLSGASKLAIVSVISTAIGPSLGGAAVVIAPVVTIVLALLANAGKATVCEALAAAIAAQENDASSGGHEA